ncbi:MAG: O-antigen ligase family protein [Patescibacteria group bacterium]|nr:O-antigen ligase family protein [Patescibacteria group bacterium]
MGKRSREKRERRQEGKIRPQKERPEGGVIWLCLNIIRVGTYLALFTPLITNAKFFFPFVGPKSLYFMGLVEIIFFAWLILIIYSPQYRPRKNLLLIVLILFLAVVILSSLFGENLSYSFWSKPERMTGLLMWFHLFAFFLVISSTFRKLDWQKIFAISIFVGVILSFITFVSDKPVMRGGATIGNDSFLGTYLIFTLFLALYLIFTSQGHQPTHYLPTFGRPLRIYSGICFLIIFLGLFLSGARAAKLSFLFGLVLLFFLWLFFCQRGNLRWLGLALLAFCIIFAFFFTFLAFQPESFVRKEIIEKTLGIGETFGGRFVVWEGAWKGFLEKPLLGWGPENFEFSFFKHYNPCLGTSRCGGDIWYDRAHNIIFDTLVSIGLLGMLTYIGIFLSVFYLLWTPTLSPPAKEKSSNYLPKRFDFWTRGIFSVLLISYFIQNLTVFDMVSSYLMFFLVLGFVASISISRETLSPQKTISPEPWFLFIILILFIFSFFYFIIQPLKTDYYVIAALRSPPASAKRLNFYKKTLESSPLGKYQIREFFGQTTLEFAQSGKIKEVSAENFKKEIDFVIEELEKSIKESPLDLRSHLRLGQIYNTYTVLFDQTKISEAERVLARAMEISSTNQQVYYVFAQTRFLQERKEEALEFLQKARDLEPRFIASRWYLIRAYRLMDKYELALSELRELENLGYDWQQNPEILKEGIEILKQTGEGFEVLIPLYEKGIEFNPQDFSLWEGLINAYINTGQREKAKTVAENLLKTKPEFTSQAEQLLKELGY